MSDYHKYMRNIIITCQAGEDIKAGDIVSIEQDATGKCVAMAYRDKKTLDGAFPRINAGVRMSKIKYRDEVE